MQNQSIIKDDNKSEYDYSVSFIRVASMFFIIFCHLYSHYGVTALAQFFNVGVPIFFMISGFLYGNKKIGEPVNWLYKRYIRLVIPSFLWLFLYSVVNMTIPKQQDALMIALNLHGLDFMFTRITDLGPGPWFMSIIMICYIFLLIFVKIEEKHSRIIEIFRFGGIIPLIIFVLLAFCGISISGLLAFFIGFNLKRKRLLEKRSMALFVAAVVAFAVSVGSRLISKKLLDETVLHNDIFAPLSHIVLAASIIVGIKWLFTVVPRIMNGISSSYLFKHLDRISIYVYVSHDIMFFVLDWKLPLYFLLPVYFVIALLTGTIMWWIGSFVTQRVDQFIKYCFGG